MKRAQNSDSKTHVENKNRTSRTDLRSESLWYIFFGSPCSIISQVTAVQVGLADELWEGTLKVSALLVDFFQIGPLVHPTCRRQLRRDLGWRRRGSVWSPEGAEGTQWLYDVFPVIYMSLMLQFIVLKLVSSQNTISIEDFFYLVEMCVLTCQRTFARNEKNVFIV